MKTSNKILLLFFGFILFIILCGITYVRFFGMSERETITGNNQVTTSTRDLNGFRKLDVSGNLEVILSQGDYAVSIIGESNLHDYIEFEILDDDILYLKTKRGIRLKPNTPIEIRITAPQWEKIGSSGANNLSSKDTLRGEELQMDISGAGNNNLLTAYTNYTIELAGAPQLTLSGTGQHLDLDLAGAPQFKGNHLTTHSAKVAASGAANIWVHADSLLDVDLAGACTITYSGNPPTINSNLSGACSINKED